MLRRPQFKRHFEVAIVEGDGVFLIAEKHRVLLKGRVYELVSRWLSGRHSSEEIVDLMQDDASPAEVYYALMQLERKGYIREYEPFDNDGQAGFWDSQGVAPAAAAGRLAATAVSVSACGVDAQPFVQLLRSAGVRVEHEGDLQVVLTNDYLSEALQTFNAEALARQRPWLLIRPVGCEILVGPLFRPGVTGCWECLAQRLRAHHEISTYVASRTNGDKPLQVYRCSTQYTQAIAWNLGVAKVVESLVTHDATLEGRVLSVDVLSCVAQTHVVVRRPQCAACGCADADMSQPQRPLWVNTDMGISEPADREDEGLTETLGRLAHHVSPITGIVSTLSRSESTSGSPVYLYSATHRFGAHHTTLHGLTRSLQVSSAGKGTSDLQAKVGALCEALERYSGDFCGEEPRITASATELGAAAIHPNTCMLFSESQFAGRETLNANGSLVEAVPVRFDETAQIEWTPVWSLTGKRFRYLPTAFCYYNYPQPRESTYCVGCSNGNAAGRTIGDAIVQGFLELVERDSVAVWWYNRLRMPGVQLESFEDPFLNRVQRSLSANGTVLWVLDLTTDLKIPVFAALSRRAGGDREHIVMGFGAHFDARTALLRALLELNQVSGVGEFLSEVAEVAGGPDAVKPEMAEWLQNATVRNQPYLLPDESAALKTAADYPRIPDSSSVEQVETCRTIVEAHGMEMLVLDQTRPDVELPVVKVVVPGLRHFWPRFSSGRLYDVPVRLGHATQPLTEDQLNPIPMFL